MALSDYIPSLRAVIILILILLIVLAGYFWATRRHAPPSAVPPAQNQPASPTSYLNGDIYPSGADAPAELSSAIGEAARDHKRVILDFGGNWCPDCRVLEIYLHDPPNLKLLDANYVLVPINIGQYDENTDMAARYGVPLKKGVPALAILDDQGRLLYTQSNGEFEDMREITPSSVTAFLEKWKP